MTPETIQNQSRKQPSDYDVLTFLLKEAARERQQKFRFFYRRSLAGGYDRRPETGKEFLDLFPESIETPRDCPQVRLLMMREEILKEVRERWEPEKNVLKIFQGLWREYYSETDHSSLEEERENVEKMMVCRMLEQEFPDKRSEAVRNML